MCLSVCNRNVLGNLSLSACKLCRVRMLAGPSLGLRGPFRAEGPEDLKEAVELVSNEWQSISPRAMGPTRVEKSMYVHTPIFRVSSCQSNRNDEVKIKRDGGRLPLGVKQIFSKRLKILNWYL